MGSLLRFGHLAAIACAVVLGAAPTLATAQVDQPASSDPIAIIGSSLIYDTDIDRIAAGRPNAYADLPEDDRRQRIMDSVVAEYVIDYFYGRDTTLLSPTVLDALNDARRQVLLQFYAQSKFTPPKITETDVANFIARNPALFADRRSYSFAVVTLSGGTAQARQALQDRVQDIGGLHTGQIAALDGLVSGAQAGGVTATINTVWQPSEALSNDMLTRLESMIHMHRQIDISQEPDAVSILLLNSAVPIPADPAMLRGKIEQRLIGEAFDAYREKLIHRLALTVLDPQQAAVEEETEGAAPIVAPPPLGSVVWSSRPTLPRTILVSALFSAYVFGSLAGGLLLFWFRMVSEQYPKLVNWSEFVTPLRRRSTGIIVTSIAAFSLLGSAGLAMTKAIQTLGAITAGLTLGGGLATSLGLGAIWYFWNLRALQRAVEREKHKYDDIAAARYWVPLKRSSANPLVAAFGLAVLYVMSLALFLDGPMGPS